MNSAHLDVVLVTRALDNALDIFGPLAKEAIFIELRKRFSFFGGKNSVEQIEGFMIEMLGDPAGKILSKRFRGELSLAQAGRQ